ncbi:MAG: response regulator transcription factor [Bacteroidota bacterium]
MSQRILLVEDEDNLRNTIRLNLEMEEYNVTAVCDGKAAIEQFRTARFNLIILDVMLPEIDGYTLCQKMRYENTEVPILFLTAKDSSSDRIHGLKLGADDYLAKPFTLEEFILRVNNLIKRGNRHLESRNQKQIYRFGNNEVNYLTFEIKGINTKKRTLSKREIHLLKLLIERKNEVISREEILSIVWEYDVYPSTRTIDNYIVSFRKYFEKNPREPKYFLSIRGVGYKFAE